MNTQKTLFEIILEILAKYNDANLLSEEAKKRIADDICDSYYDNIEPENIDYEDSDLQNAVQ